MHTSRCCPRRESQAALPESGRKLKDHIESRTDELALSVLGELTDTELETLFQAITPITRLVIAGGDLPRITPMALARDDLDDSGAHLLLGG